MKFLWPLVCAGLTCSSTVLADPWAVYATLGDNSVNPVVPGSLYTVDLGTSPPSVHGPLLQGQLGATPDSVGGLLDVTVIPGTTNVLVSNFGDSLVFKVNMSDPANPVLIGQVNIGIFAEDIDVASDGSLAVITDGGLSSAAVIIDVPSMTINGTTDLGNLDAQCVDIAPDNTTVLMCDYLNGAVVSGTINAAGTAIENLSSLVLCPTYDPASDTCGPDEYRGWPVNLAISPDGQTAIVNEAFWGMVHVVRITGPGAIAAGTPFQLWGLGDSHADYLANENAGGPPQKAGSQSTAFNGNGEAIILQNSRWNYIPDGQGGWEPDLNNDPPDQLTRLLHTGPGQVSLGSLFFASLNSNTSGQFFGVDTLALTGDGRSVTGNPTSFNTTPDGSLNSLATGALTVLPLNAPVPTGVAVIRSTAVTTVPAVTPLGLGFLALLLAGLARRRMQR